MLAGETRCAAAECGRAAKWLTFETRVDPTGVNSWVLAPLRANGWECVLGSWFCTAHKNTGVRMVVTRIKEREDAT